MFGFHEDAHAQVFGGQSHQSSWTHELIAGAAAFEAAKAYESKNGGSHQLTKEMFAGLAGAEADKLFETRGLDGLDKERAHREARQQAEALYDQRYS
ncbi:hypothetical protein CPC16_000463 [Podila verticillata]|nr:hypothetical protein BGZ59_009154 [Podila verticillata]KAF9375897.1 hypothetical protein CPC16_000463 [Podila verticillata]KAI9240763.1 MAG: hypothetical protein BYD32DRAFT_407648 [Podila humilis]KFH71749.1 hypothetical protein MVEG_02044 [Podila verticillata NRRL 6337]